MGKRYAALIQEDEVALKEYDSIVEYDEEIKRNGKIQIAVLIDLSLKEIYVYDGRRQMSTLLH